MDSVEEMDELHLKLIMIVVGGKYRVVEKASWWKKNAEYKYVKCDII